MSDSIITVENLSKKYIISRKQEQRYTAMRDVLVNGVKGIGKKLLGRGVSNSSKEDFWALKDINFEIKQGDRVGIIGRNGAGKSTLLKILSRITEPTTGKIHLRGRVASLLEVGTGFHPELTGRENIFLNGAIMGMSKWEIKKKFDEIVAFAEVEKFLDTPVKRYSSGMYVRLAFAVAAHLEPEILIVDEVLAVGDAQFQKKCLGKMEDVGKEGRTVLFVSHNMSAIQTLCNVGIVINNGEIQSVSSVKHAISLYQEKALLEKRVNLCEEVVLYKNTNARLIYLEVKKTGAGSIDEVIQSGDSISLLFQWEYFGKLPTSMDTTFHLHDENDNLVFVGSSCDRSTENEITTSKVSFQCIIPSDLLMEGKYELRRLLLVQNKGNVIFEANHSLVFLIEKAKGAHGWDDGCKYGIVKPSLHWSTNDN